LGKIHHVSPIKELRGCEPQFERQQNYVLAADPIVGSRKTRGRNDSMEG